MPSVSLATNDDLMQRNAEFYRNEATAPKYVVSLLAARNNRFVPQEDSLVMLELLRRYRPLLVEHHLVLLGRIHTVSPERPKQLIATDEYVGNWIQDPSADGRLVWCEVEIDSSAQRDIFVRSSTSQRPAVGPEIGHHDAGQLQVPCLLRKGRIPYRPAHTEQHSPDFSIWDQGTTLPSCCPRGRTQ